MQHLIFYRLMFLSFAVLSGLIQFYFFRKTKNKILDLNINESIKRILFFLLLGFLFYINSPHLYFLIFGRPNGPIHPTLLYGFLYPFSIWNTASMALFVMLALKDTIQFVRKHFSKLFLIWQANTPEPVNCQLNSISRRRFLKVSSSVASLGVFSTPVIATTYGALFEKRELQIENLMLRFPKLPESLKGLKIVQVSDLHCSMFTSQEEIEKVVSKVNKLEPDILAVTGDFVSSSKIYIKPCVEAFKKAKAKYGIFGCLGNHDYYVGAKEVLKAFRDIGFEMLVNSSVTILVNDVPLNILGVDDLWQGHPQLGKALQDVNVDNFNLLLCHQPNYFPTIQTQNIELTLSGHTHGGQIALNFFGSTLSFSSLVTPYLKGLFEENNSKLYVNRGIGITGPPVRFNSPPEITVITLG